MDPSEFSRQPAPGSFEPSGGPGFPGALSGIRIYAQLKPDAAGLAQLLRLQAAVRVLAPRTRPVTPGRLHLTLIHFGKADEAYARLCAATGVEEGVFSQALARYLAATGAALPAEDFVLQPRGLAEFGRDGAALALELAPTPLLEAVHSLLYGLLLEFLAACGVPDPTGYAAADPALAFAAVLRPHISILHGFRGFSGPPPTVDLDPIRLRAMPLLYRA